MRLQLGINGGFAINRFPEPEVWLRIVGEDLGLRCCQFVADLLSPFYPPEVIDDQVSRIRESAARYDVQIRTVFTSAFTRVNHQLHPDARVRAVWLDWFRRLFDIGARLGAEGGGAHFGILSVTDHSDADRRRQRIDDGFESWRKLAEHGAAVGFRYVLFEPMSVPRELACTIPETAGIMERFEQMAMPIPMRLNLDVDHGDVSSPDPEDTDPYAWLRRFAKVSPVLHLKQSHRDKGGHWPFTPEHNERGIVRAEKVIAALEESGAAEVMLILELSHREREPAESRVLSDLRASVEYWRQFVGE